jgi:hypothetical protein
MNIFRILDRWSRVEKMPEGVMAHKLTDEVLRKQVQEEYNKRYKFDIVTPYTNPEQFDPFNPPKGWAYDPYYECWLETHETR